jgi:hypothetical protein
VLVGRWAEQMLVHQAETLPHFPAFTPQIVSRQKRSRKAGLRSGYTNQTYPFNCLLSLSHVGAPTSVRDAESPFKSPSTVGRSHQFQEEVQAVRDLGSSAFGLREFFCQVPRSPRSDLLQDIYTDMRPRSPPHTHSSHIQL